MPHIIVEHSDPMPLSIDGLVAALHEDAQAIAAFPAGGLRIRAVASQHYRVGSDAIRDRDPHFVYLTIRIGEGRSEAVKRDIGERLFAVLTRWADARFTADQPTSLGLEIQEIEKDWTWKSNNIHSLLKDMT